MSDGEILVTESEASESGEFIFNRLPSWMPSDPATGNFKLLDVVGRSFDRLEGDKRDIDNATTVQEAETVEQIKQLSQIVQLPPKDGESLNKYRTRSIAEFQTITSEGTAGDLVGNTATILNIKPESIGYEKLDENGVVKLGLPVSALESLSLTGSEFVDVISKHSAAGFRIEAFKRGTYTYINSTEYKNDNYNADKGFDGLSTDEQNAFTTSTLPSGWSIGGDATYDDTNDRIELNPGTGSTSGNGVFDAGMGGITRWSIDGEMYIDGGADEFIVSFYGDGPGTTAQPTNGYSVKFDHYNEVIKLVDQSAGTTLASTSVTIPDTTATNTFRIGYYKGRVRVFLNGTEYIEYSISSPDYSYDGLSFGGWDGATTGLHALSEFKFVGGSPNNNGGTYAGLI